MLNFILAIGIIANFPLILQIIDEPNIYVDYLIGTDWPIWLIVFFVIVFAGMGIADKLAESRKWSNLQDVMSNFEEED